MKRSEERKLARKKQGTKRARNDAQITKDKTKEREERFPGITPAVTAQYKLTDNPFDNERSLTQFPS